VSDPFRIVWDALAARGYGPRGKPHDFRSRCPGHDGDNSTALHVWDRGDGAAWLTCFAHDCPTENIVETLDLRMRDLFPVDPGDSGRRLRSARREDFTGNAREYVNALAALERLGIPWGAALWLGDCPNCERQHMQLSIGSTGEPRVYCPRGCDLRMITRALADRLAWRRRAT
jgi:hypothetical protein